MCDLIEDVASACRCQVVSSRKGVSSLVSQETNVLGKIKISGSRKSSLSQEGLWGSGRAHPAISLVKPEGKGPARVGETTPQRGRGLRICDYPTSPLHPPSTTDEPMGPARGRDPALCPSPGLTAPALHTCETLLPAGSSSSQVSLGSFRMFSGMGPLPSVAVGRCLRCPCARGLWGLLRTAHGAGRAVPTPSTVSLAFCLLGPEAEPHGPRASHTFGSFLCSPCPPHSSQAWAGVDLPVLHSQSNAVVENMGSRTSRRDCVPAPSLFTLSTEP